MEGRVLHPRWELASAGKFVAISTAIVDMGCVPILFGTIIAEAGLECNVGGVRDARKAVEGRERRDDHGSGSRSAQQRTPDGHEGQTGIFRRRVFAGTDNGVGRLYVAIAGPDLRLGLSTLTADRHLLGQVSQAKQTLDRIRFGRTLAQPAASNAYSRTTDATVIDADGSVGGGGKWQLGVTHNHPRAKAPSS